VSGSIDVGYFVNQDEQVKKKVNQILHRPSANIYFSVEYDVIPYEFIFIS
jgi:hypothetical protein